jgi:hypothetical protein
MLRTLIVAGIGLLAMAQNAAADGAVVVRAIEGNFQEIRERVVFAVQSQGLVVDHASKVGDMLERTGKDLGETNRIFGDAEVLEFCSALVSRRMVEADAQLLALCPYGGNRRRGIDVAHPARVLAKPDIRRSTRSL